MRILRRGVQGVGAGGGVVLAQRGARFDGVGNEAVVHDVEAGDVVRLLERRVRGRLVAQFPVVALVVGRRVVNLLGAGRAGHVHHRRQFLEIRLHGLGAVSGGVQRFANHHRVGFAHVVHALHGERRVRRLDHVRAVFGLHHPAARQVADAVRLEVRADEHGDHAIRGQRRAGVDAAQLGARVRRAREHRPGLPRGVEIVRVTARAGDEAGVFLALYRSADAGFCCHFLMPPYAPYACARPAASSTARTMFW